VILRAPFHSFQKRNPQIQPLFCKYNSGSPRWSGGRARPRGSDTFSTAVDNSFRLGDVVEVVFKGSVSLPADTQYATDVAGPWHTFQ
jgi:hypothetical protein